MKRSVATEEAPLAWRDRLTLLLSRTFVVLFVASGLLIGIGMVSSRERLALLALAFSLGAVLAVPALTGKPEGAARAWLVVLPPLLAALTGFATIGYLSGPGVLLTVTLMLAGLLLGRRVMLALMVASAVIVVVVGWAMVTGRLPEPDVRNVSMTSASGWFRSGAVTFLGIGLFGGLLVAIVTRMERALERAQHETLRREQAERQRVEAEVVALEARQLEIVGRLAAGVAHDFNNNLTAIIGAAELVKGDLAPANENRELMDSILHSAHRSAELTRQLLAYSRKAQMLQSPQDLHRIIGEAISLVRRSADPKVEFVTKLAALQPTVMADSTLLQNALLNLLVNAKDAMPEGGRLTVATTSLELAPGDAGERPTGNVVLIEVLDTGGGIAPELLHDIFSPFVTTKPLGKGTGLGLAAVQGTVKSHGGAIEVESEPGAGTAFRIYLPCTESKPSLGPPGGDGVMKGAGELLLVDDDVMVSLTAVAMLRSFGYTVTHARDGKSALELVAAAKGRFRLVLLDLRMPGLSGEATFDALRELEPALPVLIWSGYGAEQDVSAMLARGAAGFVQKPYRLVELSRAVAAAVRP